MSRPKKPPHESKTERMTFRMTANAWRSIRAAAADVGMSPSAFIDQAVQACLVAGDRQAKHLPSPANDTPATPATVSPFPWEFVEEVRRIGVNVNQAMRQANELAKIRPGDPHIVALLVGLRRDIEQINIFLDKAFSYNDPEDRQKRQKF